MNEPRSRRLARTGSSLALVGLLLAGCSSAPEAVEEPSSTPTPSPTFEIHPVVGERVPGVFNVSSREILGNGERTPLDAAAVEAAIDAVADLLDAHLDDLQRGGDGMLAGVADAAVLASGDLAVVTSDLTSPDAPVTSARYHIAVYGEEVLEWTSARVEITRADDTDASATFVFAIGADGSLRLLQAGPEDPGGGA